MISWKERMFLPYLKWKTRPWPIRRHLGKMGPTAGGSRKAEPPGRTVRVGAVQLQFRLCRSPLEYADLMRERVEEAAAAGVQLLAFPENNSFQLLGLLPGIETMAAGGGEGTGQGTGDSSGRGEEPLPLARIFRLAGPAFNRVVRETFSSLARSHGMYIMAGSAPHPEGERVTNRSLLFGPGGELLGFQDKVHLMPLEHAGGLKGGKGFRVFPTPLGALAMPVCMDATYFETFRILREAGAEVVMVPIFNPEPYNFWLALRGTWPRVQESLVYGIKSAMVGEVLGYTLTGRAGIFAPLDLTPGGDGVLAELEDPLAEGLAVADLDLKALRELRQNHPWLGDKNAALARNYFPAIYHAHKGIPGLPRK